MNLFNSTVLVEPTNVCNLKCVMCEARCTVESGQNQAEYMTPEQLDIMLSKLEGNINNIVFQGDCEPTLNPYLPELVKTAGKYVEQIAIVTNGMLLTPEKADILVENGVTWFALSIDDYREDIYNEVRKYSDFSTVKSNLQYLIKLRDEKYSSLFLVTHKIVFAEDTIDSLKKYVRFFYIELGVNKITFAPIVRNGSIENKNWIIMRNELENELIREGIHINLKDFANYPYTTLHKYCGTNLFFISYRGNFAPCGLHTRSKKIFGNLLAENLKDILNKKIFREYHYYWINRKYSGEKPEICQDCYLLKSPYFKFCLNDGYEAGRCF